MAVDRRHPDHHPAAPEDPERPRLRRRPAEHALHGAVQPAEAKPSSLAEIGLTHRRLVAHLSAALRHRRRRRVRARGLRRRCDVARAYLAGGARLLQLRAKTLARRRVPRLVDAVVDDARAGRRARDRQRSRRHRRRWPAPAACTSARTICRRPTCARVARPGRASSACSTHTPAQIDAALARADLLRRRSARSSAPAPRHTGYDAVGLRRSCAGGGRRAAAARPAGRGDRRHHARHRAAR